MTDSERRLAAKDFTEYWKDQGYEKGDTQKFWLSLLQNIFGIAHPEQFILFEEQVKLSNTSFIDARIPATNVLIEQKSKDKDLRKPIKQSDGTFLTPFEQARRYSASLPYSQRPRYIVACNFEEFLVYDMEKPNSEPESIMLKNLQKEYYRLQFLVDTGDDNIHREMEVSVKAGKLVGVLYDEILNQYHNPTDPKTLQSLNMLCVRLVFCLYAEDAGVFGGHNKFHNYINSFPARDMRRALIELFRILDTKDEDRDAYEDELLTQFPYVNGGLFASSDIEIPQFNDKIRDILLKNASADFDWSDISPTIFGAVFESTLNPETRRSGGMHYTSIENIHKVIDPLFLDELRDELAEIKNIKSAKTRTNKLEKYREKLGALTFLDPACGSGNFLTETYISLRRLENEAIKLIEGDQILIDMGDTIKVTIDQFYGIEINDFAVAVAKTAMWIAESQMMKITEDIIHKELNFLPLKSNAYIVEDNALTINWEDIIKKEKLNYIIGNPPFIGHKNVTPEQKEEMIKIFNGHQGRLDYVSAWYKKACVYIKATNIECAFVSTNTIVQGTHIESLWNNLIKEHKIYINFAHQTFKWINEAKDMASVFCVIIGFSTIQKKDKIIYTYEKPDSFAVAEHVDFISPYLDTNHADLVKSSNKPLCDVQKMVYGNIPRDGGHYTFSDEEKLTFLNLEPNAEKYMYKFIGSKEYINKTQRWILYLKDCTPIELKNMPLVLERIQKVKEFRLSSKAKEIHKFAETPTLFAQQTQPIGEDFIIVPIVSSSRRKYIPIGYVKGNIITNNRVFCIPSGNIYTFGILTSNVHNSWMRKVGVRLKDDYSYSKDLVYNTFPWPEPTQQQKAEIEKTAQAILDARELYSDCSLADLYDELTMPPELRKAHQENDKAVMRAYGFKTDMSESAIVAELMKMYQELTK